MATVPATFTAAAGSVFTAATWNTYSRDAVAFLVAPPLFIGRQTNSQNISTSTWTAITFDTEDIDRDGGHSTSSNTSRYTAQTQGYYLCSGKVAFVSNSTNRRWTRWDVNGSEINATRLSAQAANGDATEIPGVGRWVFLNVGDYVELKGFQDSGGTVATNVSTSGDQSLLNLQWMSS